MACGRGIHPSQPVYSASGVAFCTSLSTEENSLGSSAAAVATTRLVARARGPCDRPCHIHRPRPVKQRAQGSNARPGSTPLLKRHSSGGVEMDPTPPAAPVRAAGACVGTPWAGIEKAPAPAWSNTASLPSPAQHKGEPSTTLTPGCTLVASFTHHITAALERLLRGSSPRLEKEVLLACGPRWSATMYWPVLRGAAPGCGRDAPACVQQAGGRLPLSAPAPVCAPDAEVGRQGVWLEEP